MFQLPEILNELIASFLAADSVYSALQVSRQWRELLHMEKLWERLYHATWSARSLTDNWPSNAPLTIGCAWRKRFVKQLHLCQRWHTGQAKAWPCARPTDGDILCFRIDSKAGLVVSTGLKAVYVNNLYTGALISTLAHEGVNVLELDCELRRVITAGKTMALLWDLDSGQLLARTPKRHLDGDILSLVVDPLTHRAFLGHESGAVRVYAMETTEEKGLPSSKRKLVERQELHLLARFLAHPEYVVVLVMDMGNRSLATAGLHDVAIWDADTYARHARLLCPWAILMQCDTLTRSVVCASADAMWLARLGGSSLELEKIEHCLLTGLRMTPRFIAAMDERGVYVWSVQSAKLLYTIAQPQLASIAVDVEGNLLLANSTQGKVFAWKLTTGAFCFSLNLPLSEAVGRPSGHRLLIGLNSKCVVATAGTSKGCELFVLSFDLNSPGNTRCPEKYGCNQRTHDNSTD